MNGDPVLLAIAAASVAVFLLFLLVLFFTLRLWVQARLCGVPVSVFDIIGMRLRGSPVRRIVHAMIVLTGRGVKVSASDAEGCYRAAVVAGEGVATATELADLLEAVTRNNLDAPHT